MRHRRVFVSFTIVVLISLYFFIFKKVKVNTQREVDGWLQNTSRVTNDYIAAEFDTTLIEPTLLCHPAEPIFLLIIVCSAPLHFIARRNIRRTWGNTTEFNYSMFDKFHDAHKGKFLEANSNVWRRYVEVLNVIESLFSKI